MTKGSAKRAGSLSGNAFASLRFKNAAKIAKNKANAAARANRQAAAANAAAAQALLNLQRAGK